MAQDRHPNLWSARLSSALKNHNPPWKAEDLVREMTHQLTRNGMAQPSQRISAETIYDILSGQDKKPELTLLLAIADALNLTIDYFVPELAPHRLRQTGNNLAVWLIRRMMVLGWKPTHAARALDMPVREVKRLMSGSRSDPAVMERVRNALSKPDTLLRDLLLGLDLPADEEFDLDPLDDTEPTEDDLRDAHPAPEDTSPPKDRVTRLRKEAGLSRKELAARVGCTEETISNIELGTQERSPRFGERIAAVLGVTVQDIWPDAAPRPVLEPRPKAPVTIYDVPGMSEDPAPVEPTPETNDVFVDEDPRDAVIPIPAAKVSGVVGHDDSAVWALTEVMSLLSKPDNTLPAPQLDLCRSIALFVSRICGDARSEILGLPYVPELIKLLTLLTDPQKIELRDVKLLLRGMRLLGEINTDGMTGNVRLAVEHLQYAISVALQLSEEV